MTIFSFFTASGFDSQNMDRDEQRYGKKQNGDPNPAIKYDADEQHGTPHHRQHGYLDRQRDSPTAPVIAQVAAENPVLKHPAVHPGIAFRKAVNGQQQERRGRQHRNESPDETEPDGQVSGDFEQRILHSRTKRAQDTKNQKNVYLCDASGGRRIASGRCNPQFLKRNALRTGNASQGASSDNYHFYVRKFDTFTPRRTEDQIRRDRPADDRSGSDRRYEKIRSAEQRV